MCELNSASPNRTRTALHQDRAPLHWTRHVNSPMSGNPWNTEGGTLLHWHDLGQRHRLVQGDHGVFGSSAKRAIRLSAITPHAPTDPILRDSLADQIDRPHPIAVRNDARIGHPHAKRILPLFYVAGIHA